MGVASGCGEQEVGVVHCKEIYRFPHTTYPYSSCMFFFAAPSILFVHLKKCFSFLFQYFFVIKFYVLNTFFAQYKYTYGQLRASQCHGSHMKTAHVLYMKKRTISTLHILRWTSAV